MARFMEGIWMLSSTVFLRKCMHMYYEYAYLLMDMAFLLMSSLRFSGHVLRQTSSVSGRYSPMSSMIVRHDR
ncbi:hypothetical protein G2W53_002152 [Senna tora]|uniref:Uncharacterized protein n=1 Tax=Senna tora TaxID=362788 RepID=A0A834XHL4_9FABA|nr:hypothetical protein G2W53_002152 [Senna tora]